MRLLGIVLVLMALTGGVWLFFERPRSRFEEIDPERIRETAKSFAPVRTWDLWELMKSGLDRRTDQKYAAAVDRFHVWEAAVAAIGLAGVAPLAIGSIGARGRHEK